MTKDQELHFPHQTTQIFFLVPLQHLRKAILLAQFVDDLLKFAQELDHAVFRIDLQAFRIFFQGQLESGPRDTNVDPFVP